MSVIEMSRWVQALYTIKAAVRRDTVKGTLCSATYKFYLDMQTNAKVRTTFRVAGIKSGRVNNLQHLALKLPRLQFDIRTVHY
jgi:hypothetical protein